MLEICMFFKNVMIYSKWRCNQEWRSIGADTVPIFISISLLSFTTNEGILDMMIYNHVLFEPIRGLKRITFFWGFFSL